MSKHINDDNDIIFLRNVMTNKGLVGLREGLKCLQSLQNIDLTIPELEEITIEGILISYKCQKITNEELKLFVEDLKSLKSININR